MFDSIEKAINELRAGRMVIVVDDENRENEGDFVLLAEHASPEAINFMAKEGRGLICTPMTKEVAERFHFHAMVEQNTEPHGTAFTVSVDHKEASTGISAYERALTIQKILDEETVAADFKRPGHVFPLVAESAGVLARRGHTEAAVDLARLADAEPVGVICEIMNEDGSMARLPDLEKIAAKYEMPLIQIEDLISYRKKAESLVEKDIDISLPTEYGEFRLAAYSEKYTGKEHLALYKGSFDAGTPVLARIHSECLTGDVFGSQRCDCGPQLEEAINRIEAEGAGVVVYMKQEGRGIGLLNKLKAYKLQEQGFDTVEANHQLGFPADLRDYAVSAHILKDLGIRKLRLLTNNPEKISGLIDYGLEIEGRESIEIPANKDNEQYLKTKKTKMNHLFGSEYKD